MNELNELNAYHFVGVPGSGKTTIAKQIVRRDRQKNASISEADDYFEVNHLDFSANLLRPAHNYSKDVFLAACQQKVPTVINSNTNTTIEELLWYLDTAELLDYKNNIMFLECPVDVAHKRNIHNVQLETIQRYQDNIIALKSDIDRIKKRLRKDWGTIMIDTDD